VEKNASLRWVFELMISKTQKMILYFAAVSVLLLVCLVAGGVYWWLSSNPFCDEQQKMKVASPDGKFVVFVFQRHCGFAAESYTHVNVLPAGKDLRPRSISGKLESGMVFAANWDHDVRVNWSGARTVLIQCGDCWGRHNGSPDVFDQQTGWKDITISYEHGVQKQVDSDGGLVRP
jgi:hypothetical protein